MYYEEKVINGVLHYCSTPGGDWIAKTAQELTMMLIEARRAQHHPAPSHVPPLYVPQIAPGVAPCFAPAPTWNQGPTC